MLILRVLGVVSRALRDYRRDTLRSRRRECQLIDRVSDMAIHKPDLPLGGTHSLPVGYYTVTRCRRCGIVVGYGDRCDFCLHRRDDHQDQPGEHVGRHHSEWSATVDELLVQGDEDEAELLLWRLIDAAEAEAR